MAYYLTIKEKNNYKMLDITSLEEFTRYSKFKNSSYSLDEIDIFTSKFDNEVALKTRLYEKGIISKNELMKKIEIRMKLNQKLKIVHYGLVYKEASKYLDIKYLEAKLLSLQNDKNFLNKLLNHYRSSHKQERLREINALLNGYHDSGINIYNSLSEFYKDEIFLENYKTKVVTLKYKSLHNLAMFVYNYINSKNELSDIIKLERKKTLEELKKELVKIKEPEQQIYVKTKKRKLKKEIDGQLSFF